MKGFAIAALSALGLVGGVGHAQTTTNCSDTYYGMPQLGTTCRTSNPTPVDPQSVTPKPCSFADRHIWDVPDSICEARAVAAQRKAVGDLLAAGRCDEAMSAALSTGDLQYATQVRAYCGR